jgi:RecA/RadA recombinase
MLGLYCIKAHQDKYGEDSVTLFYDCEYGVNRQYLESFDINTDQIIHIPITNVEELKFDISKRLNDIQRGDKVFIMLDSLGLLASKKEVDDAINENTAADMSRAKAIRSLFRIVTPHITNKDIPFFVVNHVYKEIGLFPKDVIPGGTAVTYFANTIFVVSKAQEKTGTEITGHRFTLKIHKSRFVKEGSKFPFSVDMNEGINQWSGLLDLAIEGGFVMKPSNGWYCAVNRETGELIEPKKRAKELENEEFWNPIINSLEFQNFVKSKYQYGNDNVSSVIDEYDDEEEENNDD